MKVINRGYVIRDVPGLTAIMVTFDADSASITVEPSREWTDGLSMEGLAQMIEALEMASRLAQKLMLGEGQT